MSEETTLAEKIDEQIQNLDQRIAVELAELREQEQFPGFAKRHGRIEATDRALNNMSDKQRQYYQLGLIVGASQGKYALKQLDVEAE